MVRSAAGGSSGKDVPGAGVAALAGERCFRGSTPGKDENVAVDEQPSRRRERADSEREHRVVIKLDDDEWVEVSALAAAMGVSRPRVYTAAVESAGQVFSRVAVAQQKAQLVQAKMLVRMLAGVATNLNQIAHGVNIDGVVDRAELDSTVAQAKTLMAEVEQVLAEASAR